MDSLVSESASRYTWRFVGGRRAHGSLRRLREERREQKGEQANYDLPPAEEQQTHLLPGGQAVPEAPVEQHQRLEQGEG